MRNRWSTACVGVLITGSGLLIVPPTLGAAPVQVSASAPTTTRAAAPGDHVEITVMTQNIMYGGDDYDLETGEYCAKVDGCDRAFFRLRNIIRKSDADIVGLQEPERNVARMARLLGWNASPAAHVISRFPIIEVPKANGLYVFVAIRPNRVVAVSNVHLSSDPYGPDMVVAGDPIKKVLAAQRAFQVRDIRPNLKALPRLVEQGIPVILTGDFNSPSHLDWTADAAAARPDVIKYPVRWPVSAKLAKAGFVDSYREIHPDPVGMPAFTWTPGGPAGTDFINDRIDWILHAGAVTAIDSKIVGEKGAPAEADVELAVPAPYPTDHRGVVSTLSVTPTAPPRFASTQPRPITSGDTITVSYRAPRQRHDRLLLMKRVDGRLHTVKAIKTPKNFSYGKRVQIGKHLDGKYQLVLRSPSGRILSNQSLFVYQPRERPRVSTLKGRYRFKQPIGVRFSKAPGMRLDWVGIFPCKRGGKCGDAYSYVRYGYTGSRVQGSLKISKVFPPMVYREGWPIPPGRYVIRLFADDSYKQYAQSPRFTVAGPNSR